MGRESQIAGAQLIFTSNKAPAQSHQPSDEYGIANITQPLTHPSMWRVAALAEA